VSPQWSALDRHGLGDVRRLRPQTRIRYVEKERKKTRIMIRKIVIRHAEKHNRPRGQTIYQINQRLSVGFQRDVGKQLIACECAG
jgi:hypothetical protein